MLARATPAGVFALAAAASDLDRKMAATLGETHRHGQRAIDPLGRLNRLLDFGAVAAGQPIHNNLRVLTFA